MHTKHCTLNTFCCTLGNAHCTLHTVQGVYHTALNTVRVIETTKCSWIQAGNLGCNCVQLTQYTIDCVQFTVYNYLCTIYYVPFTVYNLLCTLLIFIIYSKYFGALSILTAISRPGGYDVYILASIMPKFPKKKRKPLQDEFCHIS